MDSNKSVISNSDSKNGRGSTRIGINNDSANTVHECGEIADIGMPSTSTEGKEYHFWSNSIILLPKYYKTTLNIILCSTLFGLYLFTGDQTSIRFPDPRLILDLPGEIIQNVLFQYLSFQDITSLSTIGSKRLKDISDDYIHRKCKFDNLLFILI